MKTTIPWSAKKWILAALVTALVMVAVATGITISLAPAHVSFSVVYANKTLVPADARGEIFNWYYNLTVVPHDSSRRREVRYGSLAADIWWSETKSIPTDEAAELPAGWQPPGSAPALTSASKGGTTTRRTTARGAGAAAPPPPPGAQTDEGGGKRRNVSRVEWPHCRVVVEAKVWFRFAGIPTLPYTVTATCFPVNFIAGPVSVNCTS